MEKFNGDRAESIERFLESHKSDIIDYMEDKLMKAMNKKIDVTSGIYDRLVNELMRDLPFGTNIQFSLTNTLMDSLWCGLISQRLINNKELKPEFKEEDAKQIQKTINTEYNIGRNYASERPI
jgi:hypothetical protein